MLIMVPKRIHRWDRGTLFKALIIGATLEAVAIAPAALSPWGHAGPESLPGWLGVLLNLPGICVVRLLRDFGAVGETFPAIFTGVFVVQTIILSYLVFICLRWKKLKAEVL